MEALSALLTLCEGNSLVTGEFPSQRPVTMMTWSFDVFFDLRLIKQLSKVSRCRWFEKPSRSLWHHCDEVTLTPVAANHEVTSGTRTIILYFLQTKPIQSNRFSQITKYFRCNIDGLVQERRNSSALAMESCLSFELNHQYVVRTKETVDCIDFKGEVFSTVTKNFGLVQNRIFSVWLWFLGPLDKSDNHTLQFICTWHLTF